MKTRYLMLAACAAAASLTVLPLRADDSAAKAPTQQEKFAACGHQSKGLKGEERREFMSNCLKGGADAALSDTMIGDAAEENRQRCHEEADRRKLHGEERRSFLGVCQKG